MTKAEADNMVAQAIQNIIFLAAEYGSIGDVERLAGVSPGYLSRVAHGKKGISLRNVIMLADVVGVSVGEILSVDVMKQKRIAALEKELAELRGN